VALGGQARKVRGSQGDLQMLPPDHFGQLQKFNYCGERTMLVQPKARVSVVAHTACVLQVGKFSHKFTLQKICAYENSSKWLYYDWHLLESNSINTGVLI